MAKEQEDENEAPKGLITGKHRRLIILAMVISVLRLIGRCVFVIMTEDIIGIPLIFSALLCIACLCTLSRVGGCSGTIIYALAEALFSTVYWILIGFVLDTNNICSKLGDGACESIDKEEIQFDDYVRRIDPTWFLLTLPGIAFDCVFVWTFR